MQPLLDLYLLLDKYDDGLSDFDLDGDEQDEYSTTLLWLQNQVEAGRPHQTFVDQCLAWLDRASMTTPQLLHVSAG